MEIIKTGFETSFDVAVTHSGTFHADDVFSYALMYLLNDHPMQLIRAPKVPDLLPENTIVFDLGLGKYDHHQLDTPVRENGIKYASFGLLWKAFGHRFDLLSEALESFDRTLCQTIDAIDNGQATPSITDDVAAFTAASMVAIHNPYPGEEVNPDMAFEVAAEIAKHIIKTLIQSLKRKYTFKGMVDKAINKAKNGIMILEEACPWKEFLFENPKGDLILYVIFPSTRGDWKVQCVPDRPNSFGMRKPLPRSWWGLNDKELQDACGVFDAIFVHKNGFIGSAVNNNGAIKMAELAVANREDI